MNVEVAREQPGPTAPARQLVPKLVALPSGSAAEFFTREQLTLLYKCSHGELGRLIARRLAPLPIRVDGAILWFVDESMTWAAQVMRTLERWRK
jgi:hypothetical protein